MFNFLAKLFKQKGRTPKSAEYLFHDRIPSYMELSRKYEIIEGPVECHMTLVGDTICRHLIRNTHTGEVFYILTPHDLPKNFWIRKIVTFCEQYEILDGEDEGELKQFIRAREKEAEQGLVPV